VSNALELHQQRRATPASTAAAGLTGESAVMQQLRQTITKLARSQAPVYIAGESGSGKERVAKLIHEQGPRAKGPFVPVNCGAIPAELMESEFFGHKKGSFTGAHIDKDGLFQTANGGTLFLDEVAELPLHMQVKLLRVIQEKSVRPVGASTEVPVDVRILSATHKDLAQLVADNRFRHDLFYRLNVIELRVPALRERADDIPLLVDSILKRLSAEAGESLPQLDADALHALREYPFPGNVRELENILERATALCEGDVIHRSDLRLPAAQATQPARAIGTFAPTAALRVTGEHPVFRMPNANSSGDALPKHIEQLEREAITRALEECRYNKTKAAAKLGITFRALRYKLKKLGME
jgi:two-component system response regulator PilR (NtrC family)